jgi:glycosyltransferase involved in cell wall biosynthesis
MTTEAPNISVLIATHNRRELLDRCLSSLEAQTADPAGFEVIVANDGSSDGTAELIEQRQGPLRLRTFVLDHAGQSAALNVAIEAARGAVCIFADDDVIYTPEFVAEHLAAHEREPRTLGIGTLTMRPPPDAGWYVRTARTAWNEHYDDLAGRPARWTDCFGANFSAPRTTLLEVGGFATDLIAADDFDVSFRLFQAGLVPTYIPLAAGEHDDDKSLERVLHDAWRQGIAYVELARRHPEAESELLDWVGFAGPKQLALRRLLIAVRMPPRPVVALGGLVPGEGRKTLWMHFVRQFAVWRSIRRQMSAERWRQVTRSEAPARRPAVTEAAP